MFPISQIGSGRVTKKKPAEKLNVEEWTDWHILGCNVDFKEYPPLLQYKEVFSGLDECTFMKCVICKCVCPPPPYSCENGHLLCFSCTSIQKKSLCPIRVRSPSVVGRISCKKLLEPLNNFKFESHFSKFTKKYSCPYAKFGCQQSDLLPKELVSHAQENCPFRFAIKCCVDGCEGEKEPIRVGKFRDHILANHGGQEILLEMYDNSQPHPIHYDPLKTEVWIPLLFTDKANGYMFTLVMKKAKDFVYFWIYQIAETEPDLPTKKLKGKIVVRSKVSNSHLFTNNAIHSSNVSNEDVVKTCDVLKIRIKAFEEQYVSKYQRPVTSKGLPQNPVQSYFVLFVAIVEEKSLEEKADYDLIGKEKNVSEASCSIQKPTGARKAKSSQ